MKMIVAVALALVAFAAAIPVEQPAAENIEYKYEKNEDGSYNFGYKNSDGSERSEQGELKTIPNEKNEPQNVVVVKGFYAYVNSDGSVERIEYHSDDKGYYAEGPSVPKN